MDLGEKLFSKLWLLKQSKKSDPQAEECRVYLHDIHERLTVLVRALTNAPIFIHPSEEEGGWFENDFYLPSSINRFAEVEDNLNFYYFRSVFLSLAFLGSRRGQRPVMDKERSRQFCFELSEFVIPKIRSEFPPLAEKLDHLLALESQTDQPPALWHWMWGRWLDPPATAKSKLNKSAKTAGDEGGGSEITTELEGVIRDEVEVLEVDKKAQEDYTLSHNFEKCLTAEDFNGNWRDFDGDDELEDHQDALDEVSMSHVVRVDDPVHSVSRSRLRLKSLLPEESDTKKHGGIPVKEWDYRKGNYRENHCRVFLKDSDAPKPGSALRILASEQHLYQELLKKYRMILNERDWVRRVPFGESLDLDAMVNCFAEIRAGNAMPENVYCSKRKARLSLSISFLVDLSLSTDAYVENEKILDLEKRSLTVFGQVLDDLKIDFSMHAFFSETRNHCTLQEIKGFQQSWHETRDIVASLKPSGYTRMGPALRVLSSQLHDEVDAREKLIIFVTDGKPTDYDLYEGTYGINDVRMAIKECRELGIRCCGLALDSEAGQYFPVMMGDEPFEVLKSPKELTTCLSKLFTKVVSK